MIRAVLSGVFIKATTVAIVAVRTGVTGAVPDGDGHLFWKKA
jgi:hypothetical protein